MNEDIKETINVKEMKMLDVQRMLSKSSSKYTGLEGLKRVVDK